MASAKKADEEAKSTAKDYLDDRLVREQLLERYRAAIDLPHMKKTMIDT